MILEALFTRARSLIWETPLRDEAGTALPVWHIAAIRTGQIAWVVGRDLLDGRLSLRAMSLVYTTLLSLVPTIAIAFVVFRAFGYAVYVQELLTQSLQPLGDQGVEITARIMEFVGRVNANVLGTVGFVFLLYTVISMVKKVETAFNDIWRVESSRSLARQFTDFISMGVLGPLVLFTALGIMAGALSNAYIGTFIDYGPIKFVVSQMSKIVPYAILIATFTFIYAMIPNTRVQVLSALVRAICRRLFGLCQPRRFYDLALCVMAHLTGRLRHLILLPETSSSVAQHRPCTAHPAPAIAHGCAGACADPRGL